MFYYIFYYLIGSFIAFIMAMNYYCVKYYSPYEDVSIEDIIHDHPESKKVFISAALLSYLWIVLYIIRYMYKCYKREREN